MNKEIWSNARDEFTKAGLVPHVWSNEPGHVYEEHIHPYHKMLICVKGSIVFHTPDGDTVLQAGDRLDLPPDTHHSATVGDGGVTCMEAAR